MFFGTSMEPPCCLDRYQVRMELNQQQWIIETLGQAPFLLCELFQC
jgi:hypothetical protein